jgi:uncharacterized protein (DUF885 family)
MLHRVIVGLALLVLGLTGAAPGIARDHDRGELAAVISDYEQWSRTTDPVTAGFEGDQDALRRLPDVSPEAQMRSRESLEHFQRRLARINVAALSEEEALNHAFLTRVVADALGAIAFDEARVPFNNDFGFFVVADFLAQATPIRTEADAEAWLARLAALPGYYRDNIANMRRGIPTRFTQPRLVAERVLETARAQAATPPEQSPLLAPFANLPETIAASAQARYRAEALRLVREEIQPQQRAFVQFMEREYVPAARTDLSLRAAPNGDAYYRFLVSRHTTTSMTPEEIHALGEQEVTRIRAEMETVIRQSGFRGSFADFVAYLRSNRRFYAQSAEDLIEKSAEIAKRAEEQLPRLFGELPRLTYGVRPVPGDMAEGFTAGRYLSGSAALGQAGAYMVNTAHLEQRPLYELPALTLHEAAPGHHLQTALTQELGELPYFRRNANLTAYVEGWGLYAEYLGEEMGVYRTPYEQFGRLSYEMWRACRLVADTGIHWRRWSLQQARQCFDENTALSPHAITTELERYVSDPGQALGYKIGELTLVRLRRETEAQLGAGFDVRAFHDVVLGAGPLPMEVLEAHVRRWASAQREPALAAASARRRAS